MGTRQKEISDWESGIRFEGVRYGQRVRGRRMAMASAPAPVCAALKLVARGRESAAVLQTLLLGQQAPADGSASAAPHGLQELTNQILRCCDRALAALRHSGTEEEDADAAGGIRKRKPERGNGAPAASPARASKRMR